MPPLLMLGSPAMATDLPLRCRCGQVRGVVTGVSPSAGTRLVCYCDDCQAFAHFLERPDVLDAHGGTDIFPVAPAQLRITSGGDSLRCMRLSDKGMFRWYTECCRTPIGNTLKRMPYVGLIHAFVDHEADGRPRDTVLGKPLGYVQRRFAVGGPVPNELPGLSLRLVVRVVGLLFASWIRGKGTPSPFFEEKTRAPRAEPRVLSVAEREALRQRVVGGSA
jgi:hypothetical protein